jgi:hypothetical protein
MGLIERRKGDKVRGRERSLELQVGGLGGFEVRPTRVFLWSGGRRDGRERVVSFGSAPRSLTLSRRERELRAGAIRVRSLGNPLMTMALAGIHAARKASKKRNL